MNPTGVIVLKNDVKVALCIFYILIEPIILDVFALNCLSSGQTLLLRKMRIIFTGNLSKLFSVFSNDAVAMVTVRR